MTLVLVLLAIGFPIALIFAWILQLASTDAAATRTKTGAVDWILTGALAMVIVLIVYEQAGPRAPRPVRSHKASSTARYEASPMEKAGNTM